MFPKGTIRYHKNTFSPYLAEKAGFKAQNLKIFAWGRGMNQRNHTIVVVLFGASMMAGCATSPTQGGIGTAATTGTTTVHAPRLTKEDRSKAKLNNLIAKHANANGVPLPIAHAVVSIESRYNPHARGQAGEIGLMQIKPTTARAIGYQGSTKALYDPETNLRWGMKYLGEAHRRGGGTVCGTVLKYNAGHYAKRMNKVSAQYCGKVKRIMSKT
jgi:soluble lytic murein transglycosylase-like protein